MLPASERLPPVRMAGSCAIHGMSGTPDAPRWCAHGLTGGGGGPCISGGPKVMFTVGRSERSVSCDSRNAYSSARPLLFWWWCGWCCGWPSGHSFCGCCCCCCAVDR
uniref:Uncharacterized protein n=1 Tax=Ixodes ricinus TaxID=34613 RepID=V5GV84_IXORI